MQALLREAHSSGIHHHDVWPPNVTWDSSGRLWLMDWGQMSLAKDSGGKCGDMSFLGLDGQDGLKDSSDMSVEVIDS